MRELKVKIDKVDDDSYTMLTYCDQEYLGKCEDCTQNMAKTEILKILFAGYIDECSLKIDGDTDSCFIVEFCNDAIGMVETLKIRHDL